MVVYDDLAATEKFGSSTGVWTRPRAPPRTGSSSYLTANGDIVSPHVRWTEPQAVECSHFAEAILACKVPRSDGRDGLGVVRILEAADRSLAADGVFVDIADI